MVDNNIIARGAPHLQNRLGDLELLDIAALPAHLQEQFAAAHIAY
jgi:hypothetical protein